MNTALGEARHLIGVAFAAIPLLTLSFILFNVWHDPMSWDKGHWVPYGVGLLLIEFILLHSGAFIGSMITGESPIKKRIKILAGLLFFYSLMVWGMARSVNSMSLIWIFASVTFSRLLSIFFLADQGRAIMLRRAGIGTLFYLLVVFSTIFVPYPEWGITSSVVNEVYPGRGSGIWEREPHRAIAGAAIYFLIMGIVEIKVFGKRNMKAVPTSAAPSQPTPS